MKKLTILVLIASPLLISGCSKLPGLGGPCNEAEENGLLQEVFANNLQAIDNNRPPVFFACNLKDGKSEVCDVKIEASDIKETSSSSYSNSCNASIKLSLKMTDSSAYAKGMENKIAEIRAKADADIKKLSEPTVRHMSNGVDKEWDEKTYLSEPEIQFKTLLVNNEAQRQINSYSSISAEKLAGQGYYVVGNIDYTVSFNDDKMNLRATDMSLVAKGR